MEFKRPTVQVHFDIDLEDYYSQRQAADFMTSVVWAVTAKARIEDLMSIIRSNIKHKELSDEHYESLVFIRDYLADILSNETPW